MSKTILELKRLWSIEKEEYKSQEVGSGVQKFVKKVLKCPEIFNLEEGNLVTPILKRKNEFLEEKSKKNRRADVIIFIDADRVIPVEVEKYTNIEAGVQQLFSYQLAWDKKYGILTDGNTWRFYNNNIPIKQFNIDEIFDRTSEFLTFWKGYIQVENYYLSFFEKIGQLPLFEEDISVDNKRIDFFKDITTLISSFKDKLNIEGYFDRKGDKQSEKRAVEITYAYIIQFILFKTLVDNDFGAFKNDFKERIDNIYEGLKSQSYKEILTTIKGISHIISQNVYRPFSKEQEFINKTLEEILTKPKSKLTDVTPWLDIFIFVKRYSFKNVRNEIFGYIYENYLKDLYLDEQKGQYFTDPSVVNFMLHQVGYTANKINKKYSEDKNSLSLIDPSCGSGTFLYSATNEIIDAIPNGSEQSSITIEELVNNNIFGLDIAEFPLYLAEMNILMRLLPLIINEKYNNPVDKKIKVFKTKDSIAEFLDTALRNTASDINIKAYKENQQGQLFTESLNLGYPSYVRDEDDLKELKSSLENHPRIPRRRFDYVVGNPPYISYNECSKQQIVSFSLMKKGIARLNDIYGVNLHSTPKNPKRYRPNPNLYSFFIALGLALLKDKGKLCYIIPQTFLINPDYDVLRYHLSNFVTIEKMIIFSGKMFIGRGLKQNKPVITSSLVLVLNRQLPAAEHMVQIIRYENSDDDIETCLSNILNNKMITINKVNQKILLENISNWNFLKQNESLIDFYKKYKNNQEDFSIYYEHRLAEKRFGDRFYFDGGYDIDERKALNVKVNEDDYEVLNFPDEGFLVKGNNGYWPNERKPKDRHYIKLRQANQGYNLLDCKYKVVWPYLRNIKFTFADKPIIWSRRTTNTYYGIGSSNKNELLYLLSILNSKITEKIVSFCKLENESKREIMVSSALIKNEIKVPRITDHNCFIKDEIINKTEDILKLEAIVLSDLVDFSNVMMQKFDDITTDDNYLFLIKDKEKYSCRIIKANKLVENHIRNKIINKKLLDKSKFNLSEIKLLRIIDYEKQKILKDYIDDLIFALYFGVNLNELGLERADEINALCKKNEYYLLLNN